MGRYWGGGGGGGGFSWLPLAPQPGKAIKRGDFLKS